MQIKVFSSIINTCAEEGNKIITLHSRNAEEDVINIIGSNYPGAPILHWYSGSIKNLNRALSLGFYFSVNHQMTLSKKGRIIIEQIPMERLLTESDGPFVQVDGHPSSLFLIASTCARIGEIKGLTAEEVQLAAHRNFKSILTTKLSD